MIMIVDRQSRAESPRRAFSAPSSELRLRAGAVHSRVAYPPRHARVVDAVRIKNIKLTSICPPVA
jgi:hypothetical protein